MKLNKRRIVFGLALLLLFLTGNIIYYKNQVIVNAIFLKDYASMSADGCLPLSYVEDINSKDSVASIYFPEIKYQCTNFSQPWENTDNRYYRLDTLLIYLYNGPDSQSSRKYINKVITKAIITFSNGKTENVNVGNVHLLGDTTPSLQQRSNCCSTDNTGDCSFTTDKDIYITGIDNKSYALVKDVMQVYLDGTPISKVKFPIMLKSKYQIDISYNFDFTKNPEKQNNTYLFDLNILTKDLNGNKGITPCSIQFSHNCPSDVNIPILKDERGGN
jgi:hypothetical protein